MQDRSSQGARGAERSRWLLHGAHSRYRPAMTVNWIKAPPGPAHFRPLGGGRFEARHPAPAVAWYGAVKLVAGRKEALAALATLEDAAGRRSAAVVERGDVPPAQRQGVESLAVTDPAPAAVAGRVTGLHADRVTLEVDAPAAGLVVLNEKMWEGWQVAVDGRAARPLRASYLLRGVLVGPGHHEIVWRFAPRGYAWLVLAHLAGLAFLALAAARSWRKKPLSSRV